MINVNMKLIASPARKLLTPDPIYLDSINDFICEALLMLPVGGLRWNCFVEYSGKFICYLLRVIVISISYTDR